MKKTALLFFCTTLILMLNQCGPPEKTVLVLGHRATGTGVQDGFMENTIPAVREALKYADGVEQDVQMSTDTTIWIYHDDLFDNLCADNGDVAGKWNCIPDSPDSVISRVRLCRDGVEERIYKLEELFKLYRKYPDKYISLDVKGYFNEGCFPYHNVTKGYLKAEADALYGLITKYKLIDQIFVETNYTYFFRTLKELNPKIKCTLLGYHDLREKLDRSLENKWDGVSFNMSDTSATLQNSTAVRDSNQVLQLWTIYDIKGYKEALSLHPTTVQVSSLELMKTIHRN